MADLEALREIFGETRIAWVHLAGFSCVGLTDHCPIDLIVCCDHGREHAAIESLTGARFLSLEDAEGGRKVTHDDDVEELVLQLYDRLVEELGAASAGKSVLVCPYPCKALEETDLASASPPWELSRRLGDKRTLLEALSDLGLPTLDGRWERLGGSRYKDLLAELGNPFVAQIRRGSGGSGTRMIHSELDLRRAAAQFGAQDAWLTGYAGDLSLNVNALALPGGAVVTWPNVQLAGLEELGAAPGAYCGNDYTAAVDVPRDLLESAVDQTRTIGRWLGGVGYTGLFGLDFVVDDRGRAFVVDLNPRWQGSTNLLTQAEIAAGRTPLAVLDVGLRLGLLDEADVLDLGDRYLEPVRGSQMILRAGASPSVVLGDVEPGIYDRESGSRVGPGIALEDCSEPGGVLVTGGVPEPGTGVEPSAYLLRAFAEAAAIEPASGRLRRWARRIAGELYRQTRLGQG